MAGKASNRSEVYEYYYDVFDRMKKSMKGSLTDSVWECVDKEDSDDPVVQKAKKWEDGSKEHSTSYNLYHYMFTPEQVQRRIKVAIKYEQTACEKLQYKGNLKGFRPIWLTMSSLILKGGYDSVDRFSDCVMAAAIWILDELSLNDKLDELYPFIVDACEYDCSDFLPYSHPSYDTELISAVINTIRHRNDDLYKHDQFQHNWTDPWTTSSLRDVSVQSKKRENFEGMIALLDSQVVKDVMRRYENKVWEFYKIAYQTDDVIQRKIRQYDIEIERIEEKLKVAYRNRLVGLADNGKKNNIRPVLSPLMMPVSQPDDDINDQEIDRLQNEKDRLIRQQRQLTAKTMADLSSMTYENEREKCARDWKGIVPENLLNDLVAFSVDDPYESSFALLALLDNNSDIPWLYYGSVAVFYTIMDQLPPTNSLYLFDGYPEKTLNRGSADEAYQMAFKSEHRFDHTEDADGDKIQRDRAENIAQKIYAQTFTLLPRIRRNLPNIDLLLKEIGAETDREKEAYDLLLQVLWAMEDGNDLQEYKSLAEETKESEETAQEEKPEEPDNSAEIAELKRKINTLNRNYREEAAKVRNLQNERDNLIKESEDMRRELSELRNIVFNRENPEKEEDQEETKIDFPYEVKSRTVSFGGHPGWLKSMKEYLPSVRFISPEMLPNTMLLRMADTVWIQPNCISHSDYYRIMNVVREQSIAVHYFAHDSALKCAQQLAAEDSK